MTKRKEVYVKFAQGSRDAANQLDDSMERWRVGHEKGLREGQEGARQVPVDYSRPASMDEAKQLRESLNLELKTVKLGLSGYLTTTSRGKKIPQKKHPKRIELVKQREDLLDKKRQLKGYFRNIHDVSFTDVERSGVMVGDTPVAAHARKLIDLNERRVAGERLPDEEMQVFYRLQDVVFHEIVMSRDGSQSNDNR